MKQSVMLRSLALVGLALAMVGCVDLTPNVPKEQTQRILEAWLANPSPFQGPNRFTKGQQQQVTMTAAYGFSYLPDESAAELSLTDFHYQVNGKAKTHTGKARLGLCKLPNGQWAVERLALETDPGLFMTEFKPLRKTGG